MADQANRRKSKIERVIEKYDLGNWGERLETQWVGDGTERKSLRDLATEFNIAVLRSALTDAGESTIPSDVESTYKTLTDDDVPRSDVIRKRRDLERSDIDVEELLGDFVTHQTIYTYLTGVRNAELTEDDEDRIDRKTETIQRLIARTELITDKTVDELTNADLMTRRDYEVFINARIVCQDCGSDYAADALIAEGGCDCEQ